MLNIALVSDDLTHLALTLQPNVKLVNLERWTKYQRLSQRPDFVLVESCWRGHKDKWRYKIANYPGYLERSNADLRKLIEKANQYNIPTVFWNKEDGVHFNRFIDSASLFNYVLTVDANCVERYKAVLGDHVKVGVLPFAIPPKIHHPSRLPPRHRRSLFVGSYGTHVHDARRAWQNIVLPQAAKYGLTIVDRNSDRKSDVYRFPSFSGTDILPAIPYQKTGKLFRQYSHCLNVNTVTDSPSMFSRRLIEIMACGRLAVTNPSLAVSTRFDGMCEVVETPEHANELFAQLSKGYTKQQKEMMRYASRHVLNHYNYDNWLKNILEHIGL